MMDDMDTRVEIAHLLERVDAEDPQLRRFNQHERRQIEDLRSSFDDNEYLGQHDLYALQDLAERLR